MPTPKPDLPPIDVPGDPGPDLPLPIPKPGEPPEPVPGEPIPRAP